MSLVVALALGCSGSSGPAVPPDTAGPQDAGPRDAGKNLTETQLTVNLEFLTVSDGGVGTVVIPTTPADGGSGDGGAQGPLVLQITTRDGLMPVRTDIWLYTLVNGNLQEFAGFSGATNRKTGRLMLPATIGGKPSGLAPADDGRANGLMTGGARGTLEQGAFVPAINGTVQVMLPAHPTEPIVVVAGIEDQRYAGAAAILPDGRAGTVPAGVGVPETHLRRSYADAAPIVQARCAGPCHNQGGPLTAPLYLMATRDELLNSNYALAEQTADCKAKYPTDAIALNACIQAITRAQYLVEPGAPALSDLLTRARPDEEMGSSALGLIWFGGGNPKSRYSAAYGDRRMPSTTTDTTPASWSNAPTYFDMNPQEFQILFDWVAQGAQR